MHPTVKRMRAAIKHIDGAWCRRAREYEDGQPTGNYVLFAGREYAQSLKSVMPIAEALRQAGFRVEFNGKSGTSGELCMDVFETPTTQPMRTT